MKRNVDLMEISDGKLYTSNDMVKADCHDCKGCSSCCHGMGKSIVLDPFDIYRLCTGLKMNFATLLKEKVELNIVDGLTLPNLKMNGKEESCGFLNDEGRCNVHGYRPGICRMFPLGRYYDEKGFSYFLQIHECPMQNKGKVKVKKWLDTPDLKKYEQYISDWHEFQKKCQEELSELTEGQIRILNLLILRTFYETEYKEFYLEFYERLNGIKIQLGMV